MKSRAHIGRRVVRKDFKMWKRPNSFWVLIKKAKLFDTLDERQSRMN
ncbi:hypothetical protein PHET_12404 [Paragonimus heterotremus]|uniref:Uncharacterized protein n=1 Tax=Paragonimus heterotremus TaxID=100268 RepID=A0A8J4SZZ4_9TREM|nr:hypothetical protein PHET_12404 [Paragonimus heterotremus]